MECGRRTPAGPDPIHRRCLRTARPHPDGTLVTAQAGAEAGLYSPDDAEPLGVLKGSGYGLHAARVSGDTLHLVSDKGTRALRLSPDAWYDTLCGALEGPNSRAQRDRPELDVARSTPPCPSG
ncbi:hypothetical protein ID867_03265 [Streptomyces parvulus]|nr:hypothetical protein [Streptomyces parvulus]